MTVVYRYYDLQGALLYVGVAEDWRQRMSQHEHKPWFLDAHSLTVAYYPDRPSALAAEKHAIRTEWPLWNLQGSPWVGVARALHAKAYRPPVRLGRLHGAAYNSWRTRVWREIDEHVAHRRRLIDSRAVA